MIHVLKHKLHSNLIGYKHKLNTNFDYSSGTYHATFSELTSRRSIFLTDTNQYQRDSHPQTRFGLIVPLFNPWTNWLMMGLFLTACGGSGGGGGGGLDVVDPADVPDDIPGNPADILRPIFADDAPDSFDLPENIASMTFSPAVTASDTSGGTISYSLDQAALTAGFAISSAGVISYNDVDGDG